MKARPSLSGSFVRSLLATTGIFLMPVLSSAQTVYSQSVSTFSYSIMFQGAAVDGYVADDFTYASSGTNIPFGASLGGYPPYGTLTYSTLYTSQPTVAATMANQGFLVANLISASEGTFTPNVPGIFCCTSSSAFPQAIYLDLNLASGNMGFTVEFFLNLEGEPVADNVYCQDIPFQLTATGVTFSAPCSNGTITGNISWTIPPPKANLALLSGNQQVGAVLTSLGNNLVVEATNQDGTPASGVSISFAISQQPISSAGAYLTSNTVVTAGDGMASTQLAFGNTPGQYQVTVSCQITVCTPATVTFTETAVAAALTYVSGGNQTADILDQLPNPLIVQVEDSSGNPIAGIPVSFQITQQPQAATGATLSTNTAFTASDGTASSSLILGTPVGQYQVAATCNTCTPNSVVFTEVASCAYLPGSSGASPVRPIPSGTKMNAIFGTTDNTQMGPAANACGFIGFNWQQTITAYPTPTVLSYCNSSAGTCLFPNFEPNVPLIAPFLDPPLGGYTYEPYIDEDYPFYCSASDPASEAPCSFQPTILMFSDTPADLAMNPLADFAPPGTAPNGVVMAFTTDLVGVLPGNVPSAPLFQWTWISTFDGTVGGVSVTKNATPVDPGSGTGGVTVTSVNGVQLPIAIPANQVTITASGLAYSRVSQTFNGTVTLMNISSNPISGPLQVVFFGMPANVTLVDASGNLAGTPYITIPAAGGLGPGQSVTVSVQFKNPSDATINLTPVIYSGSI